MSLILTREILMGTIRLQEPIVHLYSCPSVGLLDMEQSVNRSTFYMRHGEEHILVDANTNNTISPASVTHQGRVQIESGVAVARLCYQISSEVPDTLLEVSAGTSLALLIGSRYVHVSHFTLTQIQINQLMAASRQTYAYPPPLVIPPVYLDPFDNILPPTPPRPSRGDDDDDDDDDNSVVSTIPWRGRVEEEEEEEEEEAIEE